jgi:pyruvate/2-oxoglutarate/acetoin dehydrogenase E1 component
MQSIYDQTKQAMDYARHFQSPCVLIYTNIVRRFGHAATDRQDSYLDTARIQTMTDTCVLERAIYDAVERWNITSYEDMLDRLDEIHFGLASEAFEQAIQEPKVTLPEMIDRVSVPFARVDPPFVPLGMPLVLLNLDEKPQVMRKNMTRFYDEVLANNACAVYLGEDVRHGGYYLVTEGLAEKYPNRILDFPPDETTLLGAGLGFSQLGLLPIVEIPYAKYLDCGVDMFNEIAIQRWLSAPDNENQKRKRSGMIIRLQGFDRGIFGGNFHTHNMLSHIPPGIDVLCFSNGRDYVRGMRYAFHQAMAGRTIMVVDCTNVLNLRHVHEKDREWEFAYPNDPNDLLTFDQIQRYQAAGLHEASRAIVTYGNGVVTALQARRDLVREGIIVDESQLDIIDSPYLSGVSKELEVAMSDYPNGVLFADICKEGPGSNIFSSIIMVLKEHGSLPDRWAFCGAPRTYNPLGSNVTFLNRDTIKQAFVKNLT